MPIATERLSRIRLKLAHARDHILRLEGEIRSFLSTSPYGIACRTNPGTGEVEYYVTSVKETPAAIPLITGDILQNLRDALDHLAYQLVCIGKNSDGPFKHVYFPIAEDYSKYQEKRDRQTEGMRPMALSEIDKLRPYQGGDDRLWQLHELNIISKHRMLLTFGFPLMPFLASMVERHLPPLPASMGGGPFPVPTNIYIRPADPSPPQVGEVIHTDPPGSTPRKKLPYTTEVVFGETILRAQEVLREVKQLADRIDEIVTIFEPHLS